MTEDFDFGFTIVDEDPTPRTSAPASEHSNEILEKLYDLENRILSADNSGLISEHKALLEQDVALKLREVEDLILPLLINLKQDPEKDMIHWPNRSVIIDKQIEKIKAVTRYYERLTTN